MILNINKIPFVWTYDTPKNSPKNPDLVDKIFYKENLAESIWLKELHDSETKYFYIEFMLSDAFRVFPLEELMSKEYFYQLKQGEISLVLGNSGHGYNRNIGGIYRDIVIKHDIDPEHILIRTESADMLEELELVSAHMGIPKCRLHWVREFEYQYNTMSTHFTIPNTLQVKKYEAKFLSYNGLWRPHRGLLIMLLKCLNVLDKGLVSFNTKNDFTKKYFEENCYNQVLLGAKNNNRVTELLTNNKDELLNLTKINLDNISPSDNGATHLESHNPYYENTYFSVVTETSFPVKPFQLNGNFHTDIGRILSEKIFKPILNKHPFIVVSNYQTLALLKNLGYKSFSPYIDESYDEVKDDIERVHMIAREVKRLCELDGQELENFLNYCKEVCEYNFDILKNKYVFYTQLN